MNRQAVIVLALAIAIPSVSCKREEARAVASAPSGTADKGDETKVVVKGAGNGKVVVADKEIASAVDKLMNDPAEKATAADAAKRKDPTQLLGRWNIAHTVMLTNGEGGPVKPLAPTSWTFDKDGGLAIAGGMSMKMKYIYTGDKLIVTGMGPKQEYDVVRVSDKELEVRATIAAGSTRIENTTLLRR